jgi:hypothetical protein
MSRVAQTPSGGAREYWMQIRVHLLRKFGLNAASRLLEYLMAKRVFHTSTAQLPYPLSRKQSTSEHPIGPCQCFVLQMFPLPFLPTEALLTMRFHKLLGVTQQQNRHRELPHLHSPAGNQQLCKGSHLFCFFGQLGKIRVVIRY